MEYTVSVPTSGPMATPDNLIALARRADELGFAALAASERVVMPRAITSRYPYGESGAVPGVGTTQNTMEMLTVLGFLAAQTSRIRLLTSVLVLPYRNPLMAAKILATIDVLSGGRLIVGCGVGWMREEYDTLGAPAPFESRGALSDEYIRAFKEIWSSDDPRFQGRYLSFADIEFAPRPVQQPHPPIWIGGESPAALRRVARLGDGWIPSANNPRFPLNTIERLQDALSRLRRLLDAGGRDLARIDVRYGGGAWSDGKAQRTAYGRRAPFSGSPDQVASDIREHARIGVTYLSLGFSRPSLSETMDTMERFMLEVKPLTE